MLENGYGNEQQVLSRHGAAMGFNGVAHGDQTTSQEARAMSVGLTPDQLDDFVQLTLKKFHRNKWTDISLPFQKYVASRFMSKQKVNERGGEQISWRVQVKNSGLARNTGMFATDVTGVEDVMVSANVPWAMQTVNYSYDIDEPEFQSDRETIIRILKVREHDAMNSMAELNEENLWSAPTELADKRPMGIPSGCKKIPNVNGGFEGGSLLDSLAVLAELTAMLTHAGELDVWLHQCHG